MNSRLKTFSKAFSTLLLMLILVSCQDTIPNRSTISSGNTTAPTVCDEGFTLNEETGVCDENPPTRPLNSVFFKDDFCICRDNKAFSAGTCSSFCSNKATGGAARLYANFTVGPSISLNTSFVNVAGWCNTILQSEGSQAGCKLESKDAEGTVRVVENVVYNGNSITADVGTLLDEDKTYQLQLVQNSSPAKSDVVQVIRYSVDIASATLGPLKNAPISQYTCVVKALSTETINGVENVFADAAYRLHFYFLPSMAPTAVPAGTQNLVCHDPILNGVNDDEEFTRLELRAGVFNLWDKGDVRFFDNNANANLDVNDIIIQKTRNYGSTIASGTKLFAKFTWPGSPTLNEEAGNTSSGTADKSIGFYMAPWIDSVTSQSYCLNSTHYNSTNPLFRAIGDVVQVDTEGLYVGEKAAERLIIDSDGDGDTEPVDGFKDYILIRETDVKKVWFYFNNGLPTAPTENNVADKTVYFYFPLNFANPTVKSSSQRLYRMRGAAELSTTSATANQGATETGTLNQKPPHDRKIGCIPKKAN